MKKFILNFILKVLNISVQRILRAHKPYIIAVTGSVGKTSTKEAIYSVLNDHFKGMVRASAGNLNNEMGVMLSILGHDMLPGKFTWPFFLVKTYLQTIKKSYPAYLVLELGIDKPGDMTFFSKVISPDLVVITSVGGAHLHNFKSLDAYQAEKLLLVEIVKPGGKAIFNFDDPRLAQIKTNNAITVGIINGKADYHIENYRVDPAGTSYRILTLGQKISIKTKLIGKQSVYSQLFAFAVGLELGIRFPEIKKSLEKMSSVNGRMKMLQGINKIAIIDDTYNSNPLSARMAIDTLNELDYPGRRVAILGSMNELGAVSEREHVAIGCYARNKADLAIFVGENASLMAKGFNDPTRSKIFDSRSSFLQSIGFLVNEGDLVLIKASQDGNYFEEISKALLEDKSLSNKVLVRQDNYWLRKKQI